MLLSYAHEWLTSVTSASRLGFFAIHLHAIPPANFVDRRIYERDGGSLEKKKNDEEDMENGMGEGR